eukprot:CAMPEP_0113673042 /NCGR_PEP_ID=MMETSP0038_2-20120614/6631_1 /TAXON_ID=2898 /ORGANISM="Cryptomonas paramecium" /LENGTH=192 /DNA_ID=CAMNT_0000589443 /DNA_START=68 /DNA_END=642 /DNA_ORIENTATION=+ /assembly_acc=CAM_ASM_000170
MLARSSFASESTSCLKIDACVSPIVDIGVNLAHKSFQASLPEIIHRAFESNVTAMVITGSTVKCSSDAISLTRDFPEPCQLYCTVGTHPHYSKECVGDWVNITRSLLQHPRCVAVGETGLDFFRNLSPPQVQEAVFEAHLRLAVETGKPVFCHERDAHERFLAIVDRFPDLPPERICVHCFTGGRRELEEYV